MYEQLFMQGHEKRNGGGRNVGKINPPRPRCRSKVRKKKTNNLSILERTKVKKKVRNPTHEPIHPIRQKKGQNKNKKRHLPIFHVDMICQNSRRRLPSTGNCMFLLVKSWCRQRGLKCLVVLRKRTIDRGCDSISPRVPILINVIY